MRIQSFEQMQQVCANGGHIRLNNQGQLVTQGRVSHFFQRIIDAFRSLSAGGRAFIVARNAARDEAMRALAERDAMNNPARTKLPRTTMTVATPPRNTSPQTPTLERLQGDTRALVQREVARQFPQLDERNRAVIVSMVEQDLKVLSSSNPEKCLEDNVKEAVRQYTGDIDGEAPTTSTKAAPEARDFKTHVRNLAGDILKKEYPQLDRQSRDALIQGAAQQFETLKDVFDQTDKDMQWSLVSGYLKEAVGSTPSSVSSDQRFHCVRTLQTAKDISPDTIMTQGTNTCFMISVINSMMTTPKGRQILQNTLLPGGLLRETVAAESGKNSRKTHSSFSELETLLASAYSPLDPKWEPGQIGIAVDFATLFGMRSASYNLDHEPHTAEDMKVAEFQVQMPRPNAVATIQQRLAEGKMVLIRQNAHYRAVVGTDGDRLILRNSLNQGCEESVPIGQLNGAEVDVLAYPED